MFWLFNGVDIMVFDDFMVIDLLFSLLFVIGRLMFFFNCFFIKKYWNLIYFSSLWEILKIRRYKIIKNNGSINLCVVMKDVYIII